MGDWQKECLKNIDFIIYKNHVAIEFFIDKLNPTEEYIYTARYRPQKLTPNVNIPPSINTLQLQGYTEKNEFIADVQTQIDFISTNQVLSLFVAKDWIKIVSHSCKLHIHKYNRLIDIDLLAYIDALMHIMSVWQKNFTEEDKVFTYRMCMDAIFSTFADHMYIAKPPLGIEKYKK